MAWLNTDVPHWLTKAREERDPLPEVLSALRFGADQRQRGLDNAFRLKEFEVQLESRNLQNRLVQTRMDNDAADSRALAEWLPQFTSARGDALRTLPLPALRDVNRLEGVQMMINRRINAEAGTTAQRIAATTRDAYLKDVESLDPQWRGTALEYLDSATGLPTEDAWDYLDYAKTQTGERAEAAKLRVLEAQQKFIESRQLAIEDVRSQFRAGVRGATSITDKAKLSAFNSELHRVTYDPLMTSEQKGVKQRELMRLYGVTPSFAEGDTTAEPSLSPDMEQSLWDSEIKAIDRQIHEEQIKYARNPAKRLFDFGRDNRLIRIEELKRQRDALETAKKGQPPVAAPAAAISPAVTTKAEFDALPSGTVYIGTDGRKYKKP